MVVKPATAAGRQGQRRGRSPAAAGQSSDFTSSRDGTTGKSQPRATAATSTPWRAIWMGRTPTASAPTQNARLVVDEDRVGGGDAEVGQRGEVDLRGGLRPSRPRRTAPPRPTSGMTPRCSSSPRVVSPQLLTSAIRMPLRRAASSKNGTVSSNSRVCAQENSASRRTRSSTRPAAGSIPQARSAWAIRVGGGQLAPVPVEAGLLQLRQPVLDADAQRLGQRVTRSTKTDFRIVSYTSTRQPRATAVTAA